MFRRRPVSFIETIIYVLVSIGFISFDFFVNGRGHIVIAVIGCVAGIAFLWWFIRYFNTRLLLRLSLVIENPRISRGESLKFKVKVDPSDNISVSRIVASLRCVRGEQFRDEYGLPIYRQNETDEEYQVTITESEAFKKGEIRYFNGEIFVPSDSMVSDLTGDLQTHWFLRVQAGLSAPPYASVQEEVFVGRQSPKVNYLSNQNMPNQNMPNQNVTNQKEENIYAGDASNLFKPEESQRQQEGQMQFSNPVQQEISSDEQKPLPQVKELQPVHEDKETASFSHLELDDK